MECSHTKYLAFIDDLYDAVVELTARLRLTKRDPWQRNLVLLYLSQIELFVAVRILIVNNYSTGIYPLMRSLMEANVDFINLRNDKNYVQHLRAAQIAEHIGVMESSQRGNPFFDGISESPIFDDEYSKAKQKLAELKEEKHEPLSIKDKFKNAQMMPVYRSVYKELCSECHNNINALHSRHLSLNPDNKDYKIELFAPIDFNSLLPYLDSLCSIIVSATEDIHSVLKTDKRERVMELREKFLKIR